MILSHSKSGSCYSRTSRSVAQLISSLVLGAICVLTTHVQAASVQGRLDIAGTFDTSPTSLDLAGATGILFGPTNIVLIATDDLSSVTSVVSLTDFDFSPSLSPTPATWTFDTGVSFDLTSVSVASQDANAIILQGMGILSATGFDDTPATLTWTGKGPGTVAFDCTYSATITAVPLPGALPLFGSALAGLGFVARRRRAKALPV